MFCKRTEALLAAALSLGLSGCLTTFARPADPPAQRVVDQVESESPTTDHLAIVDAAAEMERRDNLARVEAFLERTREAEVQHPSAQSDRLASRALDRRDPPSQVRGDSLRREADSARSNLAEPVDRSARTHEPSPERVVANQHVELEAVAPDDPMPAKPVVKSVFIRSGAIDRGRSEPVSERYSVAWPDWQESGSPSSSPRKHGRVSNSQRRLFHVKQLKRQSLLRVPPKSHCHRRRPPPRRNRPRRHP